MKKIYQILLLAISLSLMFLAGYNTGKDISHQDDIKYLEEGWNQGFNSAKNDTNPFDEKYGSFTLINGRLVKDDKK